MSDGTQLRSAQHARELLAARGFRSVDRFAYEEHWVCGLDHVVLFWGGSDPDQAPLHGSYGVDFVRLENQVRCTFT